MNVQEQHQLHTANPGEKTNAANITANKMHGVSPGCFSLILSKFDDDGCAHN